MQQKAHEYHQALPGILRATLADHGISPDVVDRRELGWDGDYVTVPVRNGRGQVVFFERWEGEAIGRPVDPVDQVELFGSDALASQPNQVIIAEGIHDCLVLASQGFAAVSATGSGRFFKSREWQDAFADIDDVILAFRKGDRSERSRWMLSRMEVIQKIRQALPQARQLSWPSDVHDDGGAVDFFVRLRRSRDDFAALLTRL